MKLITDLHIHSRYSRACSKVLTVENIARWCDKKGIGLVGTGDFTHPAWFAEMKKVLTPHESGFYTTAHAKAFVVPTAEISCIYSRGGKVRRVHIVVVAPTLDVVARINAALNEIGNITADGRPILGLDAEELTKIILDISPDCLVIPAHCLPPDEHIHTKEGVKRIADICIGDNVLTHRGNFQPVTEVLQRPFRGSLYHIQTRYFRIGVRTTAEHPLYAIHTVKSCDSGGIAFCQPSPAHAKRCRRRYYEQYRPQWIQAKDLQKYDVLLFPRVMTVHDCPTFDLMGILKGAPFLYTVSRQSITTDGQVVKHIRRFIHINRTFCRLVGYYLAEGYTNGRDAIGFALGTHEKKYLIDIIRSMREVFGITDPVVRKRSGEQGGGVELIYYSKPLMYCFQFLFYAPKQRAHAYAKQMPSWVLLLPQGKQVEIVRGWWRGDTGYTTSRVLMNQMKMLLLRLGIIPSIHEDSAHDHARRGKHRYENRTIHANHTLYQFFNLSFFEDRYHLLREPEFKRHASKLPRRYGWMDDHYVYLPISEIRKIPFRGTVWNLEVARDNSYVTEFATVHNCWTPWFSVFGSKSGFDSLDECFGTMTKHIFAIETGLSSDPAMNWRLSQLDGLALVSNSDAHSLQNLAREANVFDLPTPSYAELVDALRTKNPKRLLETIEFYPEEGKYHADGHADCGVRCTAAETKKWKGRCPKCGKPLTVGVLYRVDQLADRPIGFKPEDAIPYRSIVPLQEIIAEAYGVGKQSKRVQKTYEDMMATIAPEFSLLLDVPLERLREQSVDPVIIEGIRRVRAGEITVAPGYDGIFGTVEIGIHPKKRTTGKLVL